MNIACTHYKNVLFNKTEYEAYMGLKVQKELKVPPINNQDNDCKLINWRTIFTDTLSKSYDSHDTLVYVLRDIFAVPVDLAVPP